MLNKLYGFLLSTNYFNPFNLKLEDHGYKLSYTIDNKNYIILISKAEDWGVQLLSFTNYDNEYTYIDHIYFKHKPNKFQLLRAANKLINKNLKQK